MTAPSLTPLPAPPSKSDSPAQFDNKSFSWVDAMSLLQSEMNTFIQWLNDNSDLTDAISSVNTFSDLAGVPATAGKTAYVKGLSAVGDGKGGEFIAFEGTYIPDLKGVIESATEDVFWVRQNYSNLRPKPRDVAALVSPAFNFAAIPRAMMLEKLRTDFLEFSIHTCIDPQGIEHARWLHTPRFDLNVTGGSGTGGGSPRMLMCTKSMLYASSTVAKVASNKSSGTTGSATTHTYDNAVATKVGSWSAPATVNTVTDVSYSITPGDTCVYTITGDERAVIRGVNVALNGGIANVQVFTDVGLTTEIDDSEYNIPVDAATSRRLINFATSSEGLINIPAFFNVSSGNTYYLRMTVDATNPVNGRVYQAGILGYADIAYNAVGIHGVVDDATLAGNVNSRSYHPGTTVVYLLENCTRGDWKYVATQTGAIAQIKVFDTTGAELADYVDSVDTYQVSGSTLMREKIFDGQPKANYYMHVTNGKTRNAGATGWRYYDAGCVAIDENTAGVVGVDEFDNLDVPNNVTDPNNDNGAGTRNMFIGTGNIETATYVRKTSQSYGEDIYVGGTHGYETLAVPTFYADGVEIDFSGAAQFAKFYATDFRVVFNTVLKFPIDSTDFCNLSYALQFSNCGYTVETGKTTVADSIVRNEWSYLVMGPNRNPGAYFTQGENLGGGFNWVAADKNYEITAYDESGPSIAADQKSMALINDEYMVLAQIVYEEYPDIFKSTPFEQGRDCSLLQSRPKVSKGYNRVWSGNDSTGIFVPSGTSWKNIKRFCIVKGNYNGLVGI